MASDDIQGQVTDGTGNAVANAVVALWNQDNPTKVITTQADSNGNYVFTNHPDGDGTSQNWHLAAYDPNDGSRQFPSLHSINSQLPLDIPDGVVTQYQFEDDSDTTTATDAVGSNDASITGGTFDSSARCGAFAFRSGGSDDRVVSTSTIDLSASGDSVGASVGGFFNPDSGSAFQVLSYWGVDNNNYVRADIKDNEWRAVTQVNQANFTVASSAGVSTSGYTHVVACHDGSDLYLIIDGTEVARTSTAADVTQIGAGDLVVADGGLNFSGYAGLTDDASWANKALTESEAQALINQC